MGWQRNDRFPDMIDFRIDSRNVDSEFSQATDLMVELRVSTDDLPVDDVVVTVGFQRIWLAVECDGVEIAPGNRLGEPVKAGGIHSKETTEHTSEATKKAAAGFEANLNPGSIALSVSGSASASGSTATLKKEILEIEVHRTYVVARPNNKWEINAISGEALSGTYLRHDEKLCSLEPRTNSNRKSVNLSVYAMKKDLTFKITDDGTPRKGLFQIRRNVNKEQVFRALLAKSLESTLEPEDPGKISLSRIINYEELP